MKRYITILTGLLLLLPTWMTAADPMATNYSAEQCQGSLRPYPTPRDYTYPDSLTPVLINHVGRHGARYPAGPAHTMALLKVLDMADSLGTITPLGRQLLSVTREVERQSRGRWGALDSLGEAEHRLIATRMLKRFPSLFKDARVEALSSYSPRCIMSMYAFTHQLARMNNKLEIYTNSGRQNSLLMRPFDVEQDYIDFRNNEVYKPTYEAFVDATLKTTALHRVLGEKFPYGEIDERETALIEYYVLAGLSAMSLKCDLLKFFTREELNSLWQCFNLRQYLQRTATTVSTVPADIASPLLLDLINTTRQAVEGLSLPAVRLRFGHAETLMPLLSLLHLQGCYYMTNYFDTVGQHWRDFDVVPMAANLQLILFKSKRGSYYVTVLLNETPVPLIPGSDSTVTPWETASNYLTRCVPLYYQII